MNDRIIIENFRGCEIKTKWNDKNDKLYINTEDAKKVISINEKKSFDQFKESVLEDIIDEEIDIRNDVISQFFDFSKKEYININKVINLLKYSKSDSSDEVALWIIAINIKYLKKKGNVKITYSTSMDNDC